MFGEPSSKRVITLALSAVLLCTANAWAEPNLGLRGIELHSTSVETRIALKSDRVIPHRVVSQSDEKIVIDLGSVDPTQSIQTDFATADNIEQVILKPLSGDKIRMLIRGTHLGAPVVSSNKNSVLSTQALRPLASTSKPILAENSLGQSRAHSAIAMPAIENKAAETRNNKPVFQEDKSMSNSTSTTPAASSTNKTEMTTLPSGAESNTLMQDATSDPSDSMASLDTEELPIAPVALDRPAMVDSSKVEESTLLVEEPASWQDDLIASLSGLSQYATQSIHLSPGFIFKLAGLSGMLICLFLFISHKMGRPKRSPFDTPSYFPEEPSLWQKLFSPPKKRPSRNNRAGGYPAQAQPIRRNIAQDRPVGLNGFNASNDIQPPPIHRNHAVNQYNKQAMAGPQNRAKLPQGKLTQQEVQRSLQMRESVYQTQQSRRPGQAPTNRIQNNTRPGQSNPLQQAPQRQANNPALPAARHPQASQGLPANNTEVLDFLRNVAELMEQDGQGHLARGVKRSINPPQNRFPQR